MFQKILKMLSLEEEIIMNKNKYLPSIILNVILTIFASIYMYNMYKSLSGFVANGFRDGLVMICLVVSYTLPVVSFIIYFYKQHIKKINKIVNIVLSSILIIWGIFNLVSIFSNISLYVSNNYYGVYDALLPSVFVLFPYDMILVSILIVLLEINNIICLLTKENIISKFFNKLSHYGYFKFNIISYLLLSVLSIVAFIFVGAYLTSFKAIENALYDLKYLYVGLWCLTPMINLLGLLFNFNQRDLSKTKKNIIVSSLIGINVLVIALLFVFEAIYPNFLTYIAKPYFVITYSVSLAIEPLILLATGLISTIIFTIQLLIINLKNLLNN